MRLSVVMKDCTICIKTVLLCFIAELFLNMLLISFGKPVDWQASRLASLWIGKLVVRHYLFLLFLLMIPVMVARINPGPRSNLWSDSEGYYQYLPALIIIKDVHKLPPGSVWPYYNDKGEYVNKYTCGIAIFEFPFFMLAYYLCPPLGYTRSDYFNPLYCNIVALSGLLASFLGLFFLRKSLLKLVSPGVTFWVIVSVFFGTNLYYYATREMNIAHVYNFFLFSHLLYMIPGYLKKPGRLNSFLLGAVLGWIILIRPTNIIVALLIPLYDVYSLSDLKERIRFLIQHLRLMLWMIPGAFLFFLPQLMYWKEMTGHWLYYSYTEEGFKYWNEPKIAAVLFDVQNGLFLYSPLVLLMMAGIVLGLFKKNFQAPVVLLIFSIATYLFASWWAWWFGGAFGHRCYVEFYAILAFPLAGLYQHVSMRWHAIPRIAFFSVVIMLMIFSVRLSYLYTSIGGPWDGADWRWNLEKYEWVLAHFFLAT